MKSAFLFPLLLAAGGAASANITVEAADGDWKALPELSQRGYDHLSEKMQAKLFEIADSKQCPSFLLKQGRLDMRVGFAVQYDSSGAAQRLIVPKLGCAEAESVTAGALVEMLQAGDYSPTGKSKNGWYQGTLGFSFAGKDARAPAVAAAAPQPGAVKVSNPTEVVCERVETIGTRLSSKRICLTRAEWAQRRKDDRESVEETQRQRGCKYESGC